MESHHHHCFLTATITYRHQPWGNGPEDESGASAPRHSAELCSPSNWMEDMWKPCPTMRSIIWVMHHWTWLLPSSHLESPQHRALFWSFLRPIHTYHAIKRCFAALKHALQFLWLSMIQEQQHMKHCFMIQNDPVNKKFLKHTRHDRERSKNHIRLQTMPSAVTVAFFPVYRDPRT